VNIQIGSIEKGAFSAREELATTVLFSTITDKFDS
jgi:hypothetical protein